MSKTIKHKTTRHPGARPPGTLAAVGATLRPGTVEILHCARFVARPGELTAIEGPSGAGKSTFLDVLAGHALPLRGDVLIVDANGRERVAAGHRRSATSRVFQAGNLMATLDVRANVMLRMTLGDLRPRLSSVDALDFLIRSVLRQLGLADLERRLPHQLSGGQAQRVAIARALVEPTSVLIADEPTASLDPPNARLVIDALQAAAHEFGRTVVVASHDGTLLERADTRYDIRNRRLQGLAPSSGRASA